MQKGTKRPLVKTKSQKRKEEFLLASASSSATSKMLKMSKHSSMQSEARIKTLKSSRVETPRGGDAPSLLQKKSTQTKMPTTAKKSEAKHKRSVSDTDKMLKFKQSLLHKYLMPHPEATPSVSVLEQRQSSHAHTASKHADERESIASQAQSQDVRKGHQAFLTEKGSTPHSVTYLLQRSSPRHLIPGVRVKAAVNEADLRSEKKVVMLQNLPQKYQTGLIVRAHSA